MHLVIKYDIKDEALRIKNGKILIDFTDMLEVTGEVSNKEETYDLIDR